MDEPEEPERRDPTTSPEPDPLASNIVPGAREPNGSVSGSGLKRLGNTFEVF